MTLFIKIMGLCVWDCPISLLTLLLSYYTMIKVLVYKWYCFTFDIRKNVGWIFNINDISQLLHMRFPTFMAPK